MRRNNNHRKSAFASECSVQSVFGAQSTPWPVAADEDCKEDGSRIRQ